MPARNRATGNSHRWTKDDAAAQAVVTESDVSAAKAFGKRMLPRKFKKLLEAKRAGKQRVIQTSNMNSLPAVLPCWR